jgi:hypothetical protein
MFCLTVTLFLWYQTFEYIATYPSVTWSSIWNPQSKTTDANLYDRRINLQDWGWDRRRYIICLVFINISKLDQWFFGLLHIHESWVIVKHTIYFGQGWMLKLHTGSTTYEMRSHILLKDQLQIRCWKNLNEATHSGLKFLYIHVSSLCSVFLNFTTSHHYWVLLMSVEHVTFRMCCLAISWVN